MRRKLILKSVLFGFGWALLHIVVSLSPYWNMYLFFTITLLAFAAMFVQSVSYFLQGYSKKMVIIADLIKSQVYVLLFLPYYWYTMQTQDIGEKLNLKFYLSNYLSAVGFFAVLSTIAALTAILYTRRFRKNSKGSPPMEQTKDILE